MTLAGIYGLPGPVPVKRLRGVVTADDLVNRKFHRRSPNELWVTDITQHRTRAGWLYCCAVLDAFSRRIVGWWMDSKADATLVVNALAMAIRNRRPSPGGIVHADHGTQFTSWVFGNKIRAAGLVPSFGSISDGLDNTMMESFWSSMQIELLDRQKWKTRVEVATRSSATSRSSTTANPATQPWATAPRSNTNYPSPTTPSPPSVSHHNWNPTSGSGQFQLRGLTCRCAHDGFEFRAPTHSPITASDRPILSEPAPCDAADADAADMTCARSIPKRLGGARGSRHRKISGRGRSRLTA